MPALVEFSGGPTKRRSPNSFGLAGPGSLPAIRIGQFVSRVGECGGAADQCGTILIAHPFGDGVQLPDTNADQFRKDLATCVGQLQESGAAIGRRRPAGDQARFREAVAQAACGGRHHVKIVAQFAHDARTAAVEGLKRT